MEIIPAIDMIDGNCVRLVQGDFGQVTVFADDPAEKAREWVSLGATRIHLVDLNGSKLGAPQETESIEKIIKAVNVPVQLGGGIRSLETAQKMINLGVDRVIIGTSAALNSEIAKTIFEELGDHAILGVDAKNGHVAINGWRELTGETANDFALRMQQLGAKRVIYTDISRDGMMQGANIDAMQRMAESLDIPVIASGGVTTLEDITKLKALENVGIEGAILGKALYTGALSLSEAIKAAYNN